MSTWTEVADVETLTRRVREPARPAYDAALTVVTERPDCSIEHRYPHPEA